MGPVFRAYDAERERLVAVKLFKLDLAPERVHQLVAEFETLVAADLTHPAIARPLATGMTGVAAYLAQEYIAAESLDLAVREYGPAPASDALRVAAQLAGALDFAAVVNIHHGALHPRDVLLSSDETRLTGLGVARALQRVGVPVPVRRPYTAPERLGDKPIDARADLFSLAAVLFELVSGRRVAGAGAQAIESLPEVAGADMSELRRVFARALAETPADRYETALEFVDALKHALPQSTLDRKSTRARAAAAEEPLLPLDQPEGTDRADVEPTAILRPEAATTPAPAFDVEEVFKQDLPLAAAEQQRYEDAEAAPVVVSPSNHEPTPELFTTAVERTRSAIWPLVLALVVGLSVGFASGYAVGGRDRAASAAPTTGREFTEGAVPPPVASTPAPERPAPTPEPPAPAPTDTGRLLIRSTPAGARVTVDGRDVGVTPAVVRNLAAGAHQVRVLRDGYAAAERRIVLTERRPAQSMAFSLVRERAARAERSTEPEPATPGTMGRFVGVLYVDSRPAGAKVFLDGKLIGTTPLAVPSVAAGEHAVRLERDGYRRWSSSVRVVASEQNRVTASLER